MITFKRLFSARNQEEAFRDMVLHATDKEEERSLIQFRRYWEANKNKIIARIGRGTYVPGIIQQHEIVSSSGRRRLISEVRPLDRFLLKLLEKKLSAFFEKSFLPNCYAYRINKGSVHAAEKAAEFIGQGLNFVAEMDILDFFDSVPLDKLCDFLKTQIRDETALAFIRKFLYCTVSTGGERRQITRGLLQGSPISPVLSNVFLLKFDEYLEDKGYKWIRYSDNINVYTSDDEEGEKIIENVRNLLKQEYDLQLNEEKTGVYSVFSRRFLGYDFERKGREIKIIKHEYQRHRTFRDWHPSSASRVDTEYHILQNGTLNKRDYALLFENKEEKHNIPVEATEQLNLYNEVILTSQVLTTLSREKIRLALYDPYGTLEGYYIPDGYTQDAKTVLAQCSEYSDPVKRLKIAKDMEIASIHNIRANLRYYQKHKPIFKDTIDTMSSAMKELREAKSVEELMLVEARCRQLYYESFNEILNDKDFSFTTRTRQPPCDPINALISFGNTLLYNRIQQIIWKTSLDPRIGIVHASGNRNLTLNLDFADLFKPIITDRVIFTLINKHQLKSDDFVTDPSGGVRLGNDGKKLFIKTFEEKMRDTLTIKERKLSYHQLIESEIRNYMEHLLKGAKYKPYKYY